MKRLITVIMMMMVMVTTMMAKDVVSERGLKFLKGKNYRVTVGQMYDKHAKLLVQQDSYTCVTIYKYAENEREELLKKFESLTDLFLDNCDIEEFGDENRIFYNESMSMTYILKINGKTISYYEIKANEKSKAFKRNVDNSLRM